MFDPEKVVRQVEQGNYPSHWLVCRVQHQSFIERLIGSKEKHFSILAILPDGVVQHHIYGEDIACLYFPEIARIELARETEIVGFDGDVGTKTYYWLDLYFPDGTYLNWSINMCFGDTASIGKSIIAAFNHYRGNLYY